jgi:broad specificity phosphatase PhoE
MKHLGRPIVHSLIAVTATFSSLSCLAEPDLVIIVRHAERAPEPAADPVLSEDGERRAASLARALASANITSVFATQYERTRATAAPTAKAANIEPIIIQTRRGDISGHAREVADAVRKKSGNVLVVGHSDTVSLILASLGGPSLPKLCETSFQHVYVLRPANPKPTFVQLTYGEPSPKPTEGCQ